jgi:3-oxoadipate enol-lactonase
MSERRISVPGGRLAVHDFGDGPPVVLLHSRIVDAWAWEPLTPFLLDAGYRVVAPDQRGFGDSVTEDVSYRYRDDVVAILDALEIEQAALVGNSFSTLIALESAVTFPERFVALMTIGASLPGYVVEPPADEAVLLDEMDRLEAAGDPDAYADHCVRLWVDGPGQSADRVPEDIRELVREVCRDLNAPGREFGRPEPCDESTAARLDRLTMPVLAVTGEYDVEDCRVTDAYLAANAPNARAEVMPGVAHLIGLEAPDELAARLLELLAPLPRWS